MGSSSASTASGLHRFRASRAFLGMRAHAFKAARPPLGCGASQPTASLRCALTLCSHICSHSVTLSAIVSNTFELKLVIQSSSVL